MQDPTELLNHAATNLSCDHDGGLYAVFRSASTPLSYHHDVEGISRRYFNSLIG